ncbi:MAG: cobalt ECF transporter T component CbiQ [Anaerolineae bacterium]|nr:cobalt ECF transporter T component CbiQ [Anaerolineae bacterium]
MHWIDRFAYNNRIRRLDPVYKAGFSLALMLLCLALNSIWFSAFLTLLAVCLSICWAGLPAAFVLKLLFTETGFLLFAVLGVALSIGTQPVAGGLPLGPLWFNISRQSALLALNLLLRALGCAAAMNFLALSTPMIDLIDLLRRLRVSETLIDLMTLIYRFIFTLLESLERMLLASEVRLGFNGWRRSMHSAAAIGANLFMEAYRRSRRLEIALQGRGWQGSFRVLPQVYEKLKFPWARARSQTVFKESKK